jgi:hypothetical protein
VDKGEVDEWRDRKREARWPRFVSAIHAKAITVIGSRLLDAAVSRALTMLSADGHPNVPRR